MAETRPLYDCTVQLHGSKDNQVRKTLVTAAEIQVLQHIHSDNERGNPGVINIEKTTKAVRRNDAQERAYLARRYTSSKQAGDAVVNGVFGIGTPLPRDIDEIQMAATVAAAPVIEDEGEIVDLEEMKEVRRTRIPKGEPAQAEA